MPKTYTVKEVADILGFSTNTIYAFLKQKRIKGVRVGKGRFRIPEEELQRVLHTTKRVETAREPTTIQNIPYGQPQQGQIVDAIIATPAVVSVVGKTWTIPNLFEWFVSLAAILAGLSLFVFNQTYQIKSDSQYLTIIAYVRWILIASGVGVMASSISPTYAAWKKLFQLIIFVIIGANAWYLIQGGDVIGAMLMGTIVIVLAINILTDLEGTLGVGLYVTFLGIITPVMLYAGSGNIELRTLYSALGVNGNMAAVLVGVATLVVFTAFWSGFSTNTIPFWTASWIVAGCMMVASVYNASLLFWSRAFFLLTCFIVMVFLPFFRNCGPYCTNRQRALLHSLVGLIGVVMCVSVVVVGLLQKAIWDQNRSEFSSKTTYANMVLTQSISSVRGTLEVASKNPEILAAISSSDGPKLEQVSKVVYEGNEYIRRLSFLNADGEGVALYPHGSFDQLDLSFRDYFRIVRDTREVYVSDVFTALVDGAHRKVFTVSVPLLSKDKEFLGVLSGSVDMIQIGGLLQAIAIGSRQEDFLVIDSEGKIVITPDVSEIGDAMPKDDVMRKALSGVSGVELAKLRRGVLGMVSYAPVETLGWAISLRAPANQVYDLNESAIYLVFGVIGVIVITGLFWVLLTRIHIPVSPSKEGGGP